MVIVFSMHYVSKVWHDRNVVCGTVLHVLPLGPVYYCIIRALHIKKGSRRCPSRTVRQCLQSPVSQLKAVES